MTNDTDDGPLDYLYYLIGERPLRIGYIAPNIPVVAEILNSRTKSFEIDNLYIPQVARSLEVIQINEDEFINVCLKNGVKPPE